MSDPSDLERVWKDAYGTVEAWEAEQHGTPEHAETEAAAPVYEHGDVFAQELADTREAERQLRRARRASAAPGALA